MADPFGRAESFQEVLDYLGSPAQVTVQGQPALPVTGGGAVGAVEGPPTVSGGGFAPPGGDGTTTPDAGPGGATPRSPLASNIVSDPDVTGSNWWLDLARYAGPASKLLSVSNKLLQESPPPPEVPQPTTTEFGPMQPPPAGPAGGELPPFEPAPGEPGPWSVPPESPTAPPTMEGLPFTEELPQGPAVIASGGTINFSDPIPDDLVNMLGGDRAAVEAAFNATREQITPEMIAGMADSGQLSGMGIEPGMEITPGMMSDIGTGLAVASLVVTGLKMAGILEGDAGMAVTQLLSFVGGAVALNSLAPAISTFMAVAPEMLSGLAPFLTTMDPVGSIAGGIAAIAAPLIAWGMNEIAYGMRPDVTATTRDLSDRMYASTAGRMTQFNSAFDYAQKIGVNDPTVLTQLLHEGEQRLLDFYRTYVQVGGPGGMVRGSRDASPSGGIRPGREAEMMEPFYAGMRRLAQLDAKTNSAYAGDPAWYGIYGGQLNPWTLNTILYGPGSASANPLGLNAAQYGERFTDEQLRQAASGMDPFDWALANWQGQAP